MPGADGLRADARLTVGIIGGLGPQATVELFRQIVDATPVGQERDHLHVLIDNRPDMPDRQAAIAGRGPSPVPDLVAAARTLERAGADFLVIASNTPHAFLPQIRAAVAIPFLDMIDECCDRLIERLPSIKLVGLLATQGCVDAGIYQRALARRGVTMVPPTGSAIARLQCAIWSVKLNSRDEAACLAVTQIANELIGAGAEAIIAGCTEIPLLIDAPSLGRPIIDSTRTLAEAVVATATGGRALPALSKFKDVIE